MKFFILILFLLCNCQSQTVDGVRMWIWTTEGYNKKEKSFKYSCNEAKKIIDKKYVETSDDLISKTVWNWIIIGDEYVFNYRVAAGYVRIPDGAIPLEGIYVNGNSGKIRVVESEDYIDQKTQIKLWGKSIKKNKILPRWEGRNPIKIKVERGGIQLNDLTKIYLWTTEEYSKKEKELKINYKGAKKILYEVSDKYSDMYPFVWSWIIFEDEYVFSEMKKTPYKNIPNSAIPLLGYYVNGNTGEIRIITKASNDVKNKRSFYIDE